MENQNASYEFWEPVLLQGYKLRRACWPAGQYVECEPKNVKVLHLHETNGSTILNWTIDPETKLAKDWRIAEGIKA